MPYITAFVLAEGSAPHPRSVVESKKTKREPDYVEQSFPKQRLVAQEGDIFVKSYPRNVLIAETAKTVDDAFGPEALETRAAMIAECKKALALHGGQLRMSEEYAVAVVEDYKGDPDQFIKHADAIARFLKSEHEPLDPDEIEHTLSTRLKYGKDDLVLVDWDGAFIFDPDGDAESTIELLQLANLQLLQYRILEGILDRRLRHIQQFARSTPSRWVFWDRDLSKAMKEVIHLRATSIVEFDAANRDVLLIGDWYSARLFKIVAGKFRLDDWRSTVKEKLESLEDVYGIIAQNFSISKQYLAEWLIIAGWFALLCLEFAAIWLGR